MENNTSMQEQASNTLVTKEVLEMNGHLMQEIAKNDKQIRENLGKTLEVHGDMMKQIAENDKKIKEKYGEIVRVATMTMDMYSLTCKAYRKGEIDEATFDEKIAELDELTQTFKQANLFF